MPDAISARFLSERESLVARVAAYKDTAVQQDRDFNPDEVQAIKAAQERIKAIDGQLDLVATDTDVPDELADRLGRVTSAVVPSSHQYRTAGALMWDMLHRGHDHDAARRLDLMMKRAAQHMGTDAAQTVPVAGGVGGLIVKPIVGPVINITPSGRPFLTLIGVNESPSALTFSRPRVIDPDFATGVAEQSLQKAELASKKFDVGVDTVDLVTVGGYLNVSEQLRVFVAGGLDLIVAQLNRRLANATEVAAVTELARTNAEITLAPDADAPTVLQAIYDASALVFANTGALADWIVMGPEGWARLGGLSDLAGRPMFPFLGPNNANGTARADGFGITVAGLNAAVTPAITDTTMYVGNVLALEAYEYRYPLMEALEPSLLGRQVAVAASIGFYRPTTVEAGPGGTPPAEANGAVRIGP